MFGDNVPNDEGLMPLRLTREQQYDSKILAHHCFEQIRPDFAGEIKPHDFVVGGRNFAYGNPHIQGFLGLKGLEVALLVQSMSRGAMRACANAGVPILIANDLKGFCREGDELLVDFASGSIQNISAGTLMKTAPLPAVLREVIGAGGGMQYMKYRLTREKQTAQDETREAL